MFLTMVLLLSFNRCAVCSAFLTGNASREARYPALLIHNCHIFQIIWGTKMTCLLLPLHMSLHKEHASIKKLVPPLIFINIKINGISLTFVFFSHHSSLATTVPNLDSSQGQYWSKTILKNYTKSLDYFKWFLICFRVYCFPVATKNFSPKLL
jgi:hypothetical protein